MPVCASMCQVRKTTPSGLTARWWKFFEGGDACWLISNRRSLQCTMSRLLAMVERGGAGVVVHNRLSIMVRIVPSFKFNPTGLNLLFFYSPLPSLGTLQSSDGLSGLIAE
eukprot:m.22885 g.22885  ORF g.22885 m.22885 type:complete len:110 (-) comp4038_c0_seq1:2221-2550(-)